jgi:hypothetical protein
MLNLDIWTTKDTCALSSIIISEMLNLLLISLGNNLVHMAIIYQVRYLSSTVIVKLMSTEKQHKETDIRMHMEFASGKYAIKSCWLSLREPVNIKCKGTDHCELLTSQGPTRVFRKQDSWYILTQAGRQGVQQWKTSVDCRIGDAGF